MASLAYMDDMYEAQRRAYDNQTVSGGCGGSAINVWTVWATGGQGGSTATNSAWNNWISTTSTSTATNNNYLNSTAVYSIWVTNQLANRAVVGAAGGGAVNRAAMQAHRQTQAEQEASARRYQAEMDKAKERASAEKARLIAARKRAMELLRANLTEKQIYDMENRKFFLVQGSKTGKTYRVQTKSDAIAGNIVEMADNDNEKGVARLCAHADYATGIPPEDHWLSQKLMIEIAEEEMIKIANRTNLAA